VVRPKERITLKAIMWEAHLRKYGVNRYNRRWRSWAQNRTRQWQLPLPVTLTSDTALMNGQYIAACVQKAAALRKHDLSLWYSYSKRILELKDELEAEQLGYIMWGYGKSNFMDGQFFASIMPTIKEKLPSFHSHALMTLMWCMKRVRWRDRELLGMVSRQVIEKKDVLRPSDFIKISNSLAILGLSEPGQKAALSKIAIAKFEETIAQQFRDAVHPVALAYLWSDEVRTYILERFRRIFITARPHHLMRAYECAVVLRVLAPDVWHGLSFKAKQFYVRLSQRRISETYRVEPSSLQWDVSKHLAELGEAHRNTFRWGPYYIDIGLEELESDERRRCLMVDGSSAFYYGTNQYMIPKKLAHSMLTCLGWDIRRVRWDEWVELETDSEKKKSFLRDLLAEERPAADDLHDRPDCGPEVLKEKLRSLREVLAQAQEEERRAKEENMVDFQV